MKTPEEFVRAVADSARLDLPRSGWWRNEVRAWNELVLEAQLLVIKLEEDRGKCLN